MKLNKILLLLVFCCVAAFVSCSQQSKPERVSNKIKKSSSEACGLKKYLRKSSVMADSHRLMLYEGSNKILEGNVDVTKVDAPEYDRGIYFSDISSFDPENPVSKDILVQDGAKFYLPYRVTTVEFTFTDPWLSNKYVSTVAKRTDQIYNIYIYFPYSYWSSSEISDEDLEKFRDALNKQRQIKQDYITKVKTEANKAASTYATTYETLDSFKNNDFEGQLQKLKTERTNIAAQMKTGVEDLQKSNDRLQELQKKIAEETLVNNKAKTSLSQLGERDKILEDNQKTVANARENKDAQIDKLTEELKFDKEEYLKREAILKREAPQAKNIITEANKALFEGRSIETNQAKLREILP